PANHLLPSKLYHRLGVDGIDVERCIGTDSRLLIASHSRAGTSQYSRERKTSGRAVVAERRPRRQVSLPPGLFSFSLAPYGGLTAYGRAQDPWHAPSGATHRASASSTAL